MTGQLSSRDVLIERLGELHREVDALASQLAARHGGRLSCRRGCSGCCQDNLSLLPIEAARIRMYHARLLEQGRPHDPGVCAFLDNDGACRIYEQRPYVCRTQGLPLRWFEEDDDSWAREFRDVCQLSLQRVDLELLPEHGLWLIGPFEIRLTSLQAEFGGAKMQRVHMRTLFRSTAL